MRPLADPHAWSERFGFDGETAIVTGSTKGIGRGIAGKLAAAGANVVVNARTEADVQRVATELADETGADTLGVAGDVSDPDDVEHLVAKAEYGESIPLGRVGEPADLGDGVLFLASDAASYVTGHVLRVSGGKNLE